MRLYSVLFCVLALVLMAQAFYVSLGQIETLRRLASLHSLDEARLEKIEQMENFELQKDFRKFTTDAVVSRGRKQYASACRKDKTYIVDLEDLGNP